MINSNNANRVVRNAKKRIRITDYVLLYSMIIICVFSLAFINSGQAEADSIWKPESASPFSTGNAYKIGDIVNILILESTSAQNRAGTKTGVRDDLAIKYAQTISSKNPSGAVSGALSNTYDGSGQTSRTSNVQARISAWVTDVLPNGNLAIEGRHKIEVNDEVQEINVKGVIRPKDISGANTVYSYQIANANLSIKGTGAVAEADSPGWLTRLLNWLF